MRIQIIDELNGKRLFKTIFIFWADKHWRASRGLRWKISQFYWNACWWLYDNTKLFGEIPEGERFSWRSLKALGGDRKEKYVDYRWFSRWCDDGGRLIFKSNRGLGYDSYSQGKEGH